MEWQPIETAPKDGTRILLVCAPHVPAVGAWCEDRKCWDYLEAGDFANEGAWQDHLYASCDWPVTHWMHLPPPPAY